MNIDTVIDDAVGSVPSKEVLNALGPYGGNVDTYGLINIITHLLSTVTHLENLIKQAEVAGYHAYEGGVCPWCNNCLEHDVPIRPGSGTTHCISTKPEYEGIHTPNCPAFTSQDVVRLTPLSKG